MLEELADEAEHGVGATVEAVLERTGYLAELEAERSIEAAGRIENLHELVGVAREFDEALERGDVVGAAANSVAAALGADDPAAEEGGEAGGGAGEGEEPPPPLVVPVGIPRIQAFLEALSLVTDMDDYDADQSAVTLMTLHSRRTSSPTSGPSATPTSSTRSAASATSASPGPGNGSTSATPGAGTCSARPSTTPPAGSWPRSPSSWCG